MENENGRYVLAKIVKGGFLSLNHLHIFILDTKNGHIIEKIRKIE